MKFIVFTRTLYVLTSSTSLVQLPIQLKKSGLRVGEVVGTFTAVQCVSLVLGSWLSTKLSARIGGLRNVALSSLVLFVGCQVLYWSAAVSSSISVFFLAQAIHGVVSSLFSPISNTLTEIQFQGKSTRKKRGYLQTISNLADHCGSIIGVWLISSQLGLLAWGVGVAGSALVLVLFVSDRIPELPITNEKLNWQQFVQVPVLKAIYPAYFTSIVQGMLLVSGTLYLKSNGVNPVILAIGMVVGIGAKPLIGILTEKKGNRIGIAVSLLCLIIGLVGLVTTPHLQHHTHVGYWISSILLGAGASGSLLGYLNIALETASDKKTAAFSTYLLVMRLGILIGQLGGAYLGYLESWYSSIGITLFCLTLLWLPGKTPA